MRIKSLFKEWLKALHRIISRSPHITRWYVTALSALLRPLPFYKIKEGVVDSFNYCQWPQVKLSPQEVRVGPHTVIKLIPHMSEFDFAVLFNEDLRYEKEVFSYLETRGSGYDAIIDIGANIGAYTLFFSKICVSPKGRANIFAFEPSKEAFERLLANITLNGALNVSAFNCGIGCETIFQDFFEPEGHLTNGSFNVNFAEKFSPSIKTSKVLVINGAALEGLVSGFKNIFLKIDAEGWEVTILKAAEGFINTHKPDIMIEVLPIYQDELNRLGFLLSGSYKIFNITNRGLVEHRKFEASEFRNYILLPNPLPERRGD